MIFHVPFSPYSLKIIIVTLIIIQKILKAGIKNNAYAASLKAVAVGRTSLITTEEILGSSENMCVCVCIRVYVYLCI